MVESDPGQGFGLGGVVTSVIRKSHEQEKNLSIRVAERVEKGL